MKILVINMASLPIMLHDEGQGVAEALRRVTGLDRGRNMG